MNKRFTNPDIIERFEQISNLDVNSETLIIHEIKFNKAMCPNDVDELKNSQTVMLMGTEIGTFSNITDEDVETLLRHHF